MKKKWGIILAVVLVIAVAVAAVIIVRNNQKPVEPISEPTTEPTAEVTVTEAPTAEPEPTAVPVPEGRVRIDFWHTFTKGQKETLETLAAEFNASQDKYYLVCEANSSNGFTSKVRTAVVNGEGPDIIFNYASEAASYVNADDPTKNLVVDLSQYLNDPEIGIKDWETLMDKVVVDEAKGFADGQMHIMPLVRTGPILFYNKTIFDELGLKVPTTWTELAEAAKTIKEKKGIYGFAADSLTDMMQSIIMQNGSEYIDVAAREARINNDITVDAVTWYGDNVKAGYFAPAPTSDYYSNDMNSQLVAMYIGSCAGIPYLFDKDNGWELALAPIPQEGETRWYPAWDRGAIVFTSNEEEQKGAYEFIKFFIQPENNLRWCESMIALSPFNATQELDGYKALVEANPALQTVAECLPDAGFLPSVQGASVVRDQLKSLCQLAGDSENTTPVSELVADAEKTCNEALKGE